MPHPFVKPQQDFNSKCVFIFEDKFEVIFLTPGAFYA